MTTDIGPIDDPAVWLASDFAGKDDFAFNLESRHVAALDRALDEAGARGLTLQTMGPDDFPLHDIAEDVAALRRTVMDGRGFVLLRGLPVDRWSLNEAEMAYYGLGTHLGKAVSQSLMGDRLGHVVDASRGKESARGYRSAKELDPHTDSDDIVGLFCLKAGKEGGESLLTSSLAVHNILAEEHPEALARLHRGFRYHWNGEAPPGEPPITPYEIPVFADVEGKTSCIYLRHFINLAADELNGGHSAEDQAALDAFDEVARRPGVQLRFRLAPGEAILFNNYTCLHARTAFVDFEEPERKRHLLRLWLKAWDGRPIHEAFRRYYGEDGMPEQARGKERYAGDTMGAPVEAAQ